jgi:hypothetical protein
MMNAMTWPEIEGYLTPQKELIGSVMDYGDFLAGRRGDR